MRNRRSILTLPDVSMVIVGCYCGLPYRNTLTHLVEAPQCPEIVMRNINDVLNFRGDISPFLVHLTRGQDDGQEAHEVLETILTERRLVAGSTAVSDARFGTNTIGMEDADKLRFFSAICFTETPLSEVHCLLEIAYRGINLAPYGLVFLKELLATRGVAPVLYINNVPGDKDTPFQALVTSVLGTAAAEKFLPLLSVFGRKLTAPGAAPAAGTVNFLWEREWRLPHASGHLQFDVNDVFVGLCPHEDIEHFEAMFAGIGFIDPTRSMKWYATKLIQARQRLNLRSSVV